VVRPVRVLVCEELWRWADDYVVQEADDIFWPKYLGGLSPPSPDTRRPWYKVYILAFLMSGACMRSINVSARLPYLNSEILP
jgi:hypothetical protein